MKTPWRVLRERFPNPEDFYEWLAGVTPRDAVRNLRDDMRRAGMRMKHPIDLLERTLPDWDGTGIPGPQQIGSDNVGLNHLLARQILPALVNLLPTLRDQNGRAA